MKKKLMICAAATATIMAGGSYLAAPASAAMGEWDCTLEETAVVFDLADSTCKAQGYDFGWPISCSGDGGSPSGLAECVNIR